MQEDFGQILINTLLITFGPRPLKNVEIPSVLAIINIPLRAFGYIYRDAGGFTPSAHILTRITWKLFNQRKLSLEITYLRWITKYSSRPTSQSSTCNGCLRSQIATPRLFERVNQ